MAIENYRIETAILGLKDHYAVHCKKAFLTAESSYSEPRREKTGLRGF